MSKEFECSREVDLHATPDQVWEAISTTAGNAAWLFPVPVDPDSDDIVAWEEPHHLAVRQQQDDWFNALDYTIIAREGGTTTMRYVHSGVFQDDWDAQYDAVQQHTDFYLHTLGQYLEHFAGRSATYVGDVPQGIVGPASTASPEGFLRLQQALGLSEQAGEGDAVHTSPGELGPIDGVIDYKQANFLGIRTGDALYCFFGRNTFGSPVGMSIHSFAAGIDAGALQQAWKSWLDTTLG
jgi:uncharacterized protein YndB with AHSA1/START domain